MPTPTTRNGFRKPDVGSDNNTWGANLNAAVFDLVDSSLDGWTTISTSGATTLTATQYVANQARQRFLHYTASSSGTITIPSVEKWYIVWAENADVTLTTGGVSATVKAGSIALVVCDGSDCTKVQDNDFNGAELTNVGTPTSNGSVVNKAYADGLALAQSDLPGQNSGTLYNSVFSGGAPGTATWRRSHPQSTSNNTGQVLKSTGTDGYPETALQWDWDSFQGDIDKSSNYTVALTDRGKKILCTSTFTLSLTAAATLGNKFYCRIVNSGTGLITIDPNASETITFPGQSAKTTIVLVPGEGIDLSCNGANFTATVCQQAGLVLYAYEQTAPSYVNSTWTARLPATLDTNKLGVTYSAGTLQNVPPGRYRAQVSAMGVGLNGFGGRLYDATAATVLFYSETGYAANFGSGAYIADHTRGDQEITLSVTSNLVFETYSILSATGTAWASGAIPGGGATAKYAEIRLTRVGP